MLKSTFFIFKFIKNYMLKSYQREKAVEYARKWALSRNPDFGNFNGIGGDCTNFISQCLLAGGGIMNYDYIKGWYFNNMTDRSPSWTSVAYLQKYLLRENGKGPIAKIVDLDKIEIGDLIQLRQNKTHFNHTLIVSKIMGRNIYVCAHSNDALDRPVESYSYNALLSLKIRGILE